MPDSGGSGAPSDAQEVQITFTRARNGKRRTIPVWFTLNEGKMELLPMYGLKTKWFTEVEKSGRIGLTVKDWKMDAGPAFVRDPHAVDSIKRRFGAKYGEGNVKKYYPTSEVALEIGL
ncbi:MAG: DUF2255 family protein [Thaumarchaeota archaeon]|nr:DUF2255 family protein [Nitrososphaerota archaeon]